MLPVPVEEATRRVAIAAAGIRPGDIARWSHEGLDALPYVELVGVVSRIAALDVAGFGLELPRFILPDAVPGAPAGVEVGGTEITTAWVPTVGPASAQSSLSAVAAEQDALSEVMEALYIRFDEIADPGIERDGLSRHQLELVAARTSKLNECFY
ncbi:MAG: hypothetical protein R2695_14070 [Acidimicrobiales bacterium]